MQSNTCNNKKLKLQREQKESQPRVSPNVHKLWSPFLEDETTSVKDWFENFKKPKNILNTWPCLDTYGTYRVFFSSDPLYMLL